MKTIKNLFILLIGILILLWSTHEVQGQFLANEVCEVLNHTAFQLQLVGPILLENIISTNDTDLNSCSQHCCNYEACDVALFADESCVMFDCQSVSSHKCQPSVASNEVDPFVAGKFSTLIYVKKRNSEQDDLVALNIFDSIIKDEKKNSNASLNVDALLNVDTSLNNTTTALKVEEKKIDPSELDQNSPLNNTTTALKVEEKKIDPSKLDQNLPFQGQHVLSTVALSNVTQNNILSKSSEVPSSTSVPLSVTTTTTPLPSTSSSSTTTPLPSTLSVTTTTTTPLPSTSSSSTLPIISTTSTLATVTVSTTQSTQLPSTTMSAHTHSVQHATTTTASTTTQRLQHLVVTIIGTTEIQLPTNAVTLHAEVNGTAVQAGGYTYKWVFISHPQDDGDASQGEETTHENSLKLENLKAGSYQYKVQVTDARAYGEAFVNITVGIPVRVNTAPVALISPVHQEITLPNDNTILDGSGSQDDDGISTFLWEMTGRPLNVENEPWNSNDQRTLELKDLVAGDYEFKLTVTDTDGVSNSTRATVTVNKKIDRKPVADAGSNKLIHLPQNSVTLYANNSRDDYGIVSYKWMLSSESKNEVMDMQGARTSELHLSNLEAGNYEFQLTVTDTSGQEDTATVMVNVQPESNHPPKANAGQDNQVYIPLDGSGLSVNLDGSKSTDDKKITTVQWTQSKGPAETTIANPQSIATSVSGLNQVGNYVFILTVGDEEGETTSDDVTIIVNEIQPPVVDAGPDKTLILPDDVILLYGGNSHDEYGIKSFLWARGPSSPASGRIVNGTDTSSTMVVQGLTEGKYTFKLTVTNIRGKFAADDVIVQVKTNPRLNNLVELHLRVQASDFTEATKNIIAKQIPLLLSLVDNEEVVVQSVYPEHRNEHLVLLFYVEKSDGKYMEAIDVVSALNAKLQPGMPLFDVDVILVDTYVCENNCSGHGVCHSGSKLCECDTFWMQNFLRFYMGDNTSNCDWSVLYFVIVCFIIVCVTIAGCYAFFIFCFRKRGKMKGRLRKRRKNYMPLSNGNTEKIPLKQTKNGVLKNGFRNANAYRSNALMRSMTSSSDEDDTLYEKQKLLKNGHKKSSRTKTKMSSGPLLDIEAGRGQVRSEDEFDGTGLDKASVTLHGRKSSEEDVL